MTLQGGGGLAKSSFGLQKYNMMCHVGEGESYSINAINRVWYHYCDVILET